ncbi:MAG: DUF819 family protein, partial [Saprospiraceae bacterium]
VVYNIAKTKNNYLQKVLDWLPAILLSYLIPAIISILFGYDGANDPIHQWSKSFIIPLTIVAVMSSLSIHQLKAVGWKPILIFASGSFFIAFFPIMLFIMGKFIPGLKDWLLTGDQWKGLVTIIGSWVGGSTSQLVLKEAVACPEAVFLAILIFDNVIVNLWTIFMFQFIKKSSLYNHILKIKDDSIPDQIRAVKDHPIHPILAFFCLIVVVFLHYFFITDFVAQILSLSLIGLIISNFWPPWNEAFALKLGGVLIIIVMSILGLKLRLDNLTFDPLLIGILLIWIIGHLVFTVLIAKLLRVHLAWVAIGSMANVGGIATAPAVTAAYKPAWMPHAILLAVLSMATGTFWGLLTITIIENLFM